MLLVCFHAVLPAERIWGRRPADSGAVAAATARAVTQRYTSRLISWPRVHRGTWPLTPAPEPSACTGTPRTSRENPQRCSVHRALCLIAGCSWLSGTFAKPWILWATQRYGGAYCRGPATHRMLPGEACTGGKGWFVRRRSGRALGQSGFGLNTELNTKALPRSEHCIWISVFGTTLTLCPWFGHKKQMTV